MERKQRKKTRKESNWKECKGTTKQKKERKMKQR